MVCSLVCPRKVEMHPFKIEIDHTVLDELAARLKVTRLPDLPPGTGWADGCDVAQFRSFLDYWRTAFDWRAFEARVNRWPQFLAHIDGCDIHFIRVSSAGAGRRIPLLVLHGWPGSFVEWIVAAEQLTEEVSGVGFDVIIPSLPGFGFSQRPSEGEMSMERTAHIFSTLMRSLGHDRYFVQGGDFGAGVGSWLALRHPDEVIVLHLNFIPGSYQPFVGPGQEPTPEERAYLTQRTDWIAREGAYAHVHGTRPHALSIGLNDSPAGLAAWILEKFAAWADCGGQIDRLPVDLLAANLTVYWATGTLASSIEFYRDARRKPLQLASAVRITPPCAVAH